VISARHQDTDNQKLPHVTEELQRHIDEPPPAALHHYTNQHGLLGILTSGEIWATTITDLNDRKEFEHAKDVALRVISALLKEERDENRRRHLGYLRKAAANAGINICVASWSVRADDLSQWRAYGGTGTGYSIDMNGATLKARADTQDFILAACIYKPDEQERIIRSIVERNLEKNIRDEGSSIPPRDNDDFMLTENGGSFAYHMNRYAALFKHPGFAAEEEWRLISKPLPVTQMEFRPGISTIASHFRFLLRDDPSATKIRLASVHIGPCPEQELAQRNVRFLLAKHAHAAPRPEVVMSRLPYRTW
jgi:hypothetical protein